MENAAQEEKYLPEKPQELPSPHDVQLPEHTQPIFDHDVRTLLSWHAPGRPFRRRGKEYYINIFLITLAIEVILFLFQQHALMAVVAALVFVNYALKTVAPHDFRYRISSEGVTIEDHFYLWQELYDFYFKQQDGSDLLHIRTRAYFPGELTLVLGDVHREQVKSTLLLYLPFREYIKPTFMEKSGDWLAKTFPLERTKPHHT